MATAYIAAGDAQARLKDAYARLYELPAQQADLAADLGAANAAVDSYVGRRYALPVTSAAALAYLKELALGLFEEIAWRRAAGDELPKKIQTAADNARKQLEAVAQGRTIPGGATDLGERGAGADAILVDGPEPSFRREDMEGY